MIFKRDKHSINHEAFTEEQKLLLRHYASYLLGNVIGSDDLYEYLVGIRLPKEHQPKSPTKFLLEEIQILEESIGNAEVIRKSEEQYLPLFLPTQGCSSSGRQENL